VNGTISLDTLGGGVASEKFREEFQKLVENILDPNTDPKAKRTVTLTVTVQPSIDRREGEIEVSCQAKLAPSVSYSTRAYFGKNKDQLCLAYEDNPKQITIDQFVEANKEKVTPIAVASEGGES
jgi:hypothetical protein